MPSIPEFNAPALDIRPSEIGVESTAAAGRRLGVYGSQIAEADVSTGRAIAGGVKSVGDAAEQYAAHQNIISLARHGADVMAAGSQSLNAYFRGDDIPDDPNNPGAKKAALDERLNNPAAAKNWLDNTLNPMLDQYQQGAWTEGGQAYATHFTENLRTHLTTAALADQSTGAGLAAKDSMQKMADSINTAMFKLNDLHSVTGFLNQLDGAINAIGKSSPTIKATDFARLKEWGEEQKARGLTTAIQGRMINGQSYDDLVKTYPQYIKPGENAMFERQARTYAHMDQAAVKSAAAADRQNAKEQFNHGANQIEASTIPTEVGQRVQIPKDYWNNVKQLSLHPGADLEPGRLAGLIKTGDELTARLNKDDPITVKAVEDHLMAGLFDPVHPTQVSDVLRAQADLSDASVKRLTASVNMLHKEALDDPVFKDTMAGARQLVEGMTAFEKQHNAGKYAAFAQDFLPKYMAMKAAGTLPDGALNMQDPNSMISKAIATANPPDLPAMVGANGGVGAPLPVYTAPAKAAAPTALPVDSIRTFNGVPYRFKGGNQYDQKNWEPTS